MPLRLDGEIAIVTGSDSGIGQATAIAMAREGADVAITYFHDDEGAQKTKSQVEQCGRRAYVHQLDQRDPKQVHRFFDDVKETLGTPTVLVNNAAVDMSGKPLIEMTYDEWDNEIRTNLYGPFFLLPGICTRFGGQKSPWFDYQHHFCSRGDAYERSFGV